MLASPHPSLRASESPFEASHVKTQLELSPRWDWAEKAPHLPGPHQSEEVAPLLGAPWGRDPGKAEAWLCCPDCWWSQLSSPLLLCKTLASQELGVQAP